MSGLGGLPLFAPSFIKEGRLLHIPANFQATSAPERAFDIIEMGGLLSIKAHIGEGMLDSVTKLYMNYLDSLVCRIEDRCGDDVRWMSMGEICVEAYTQC